MYESLESSPLPTYPSEPSQQTDVMVWPHNHSVPITFANFPYQELPKFCSITVGSAWFDLGSRHRGLGLTETKDVENK